LIKVLSIVVAAITVLAYLSPYVSPEVMWMAGFFSLAIPVLLIINFLLLAYFLVKFDIMLLLPLCLLVLGNEYIASSFSYNPVPKSMKQESQISVLNYNVRVFNTYAYLQSKNRPGKSMIDWLKEDSADIKCLQEFYNHSESEIFNTVEKLSESEQYHSLIRPAYTNSIGAEFGLAIFSRYPIAHSGEVTVRSNPNQHAIFADVVTGPDTIRVYNIHLQSMSIDENKIDDFDQASETYLDIAKKLRFGFVERAKQVDNLIEHILQCPYPVIVCGDFNDIPYSYTYRQLRRHLSNAFEEAGHGLGFSYNGRLFFLRIDNQFYSNGLEALRFITFREVPFSDHFPVKTVYSVQD